MSSSRTYLKDGREEDPLLILAHGAGAGAASDFMCQMANRVAQQGLYVVRFNFSYMIKRIQDRKQRPPDRAPALLADFRQVVEELDRPCVIAGKSMGGRMATMLAAEKDCPRQIKGCAALGYPFHPPAKPENLRTQHLQNFAVPTVIFQGTRDKMGTRQETAEYPLDRRIDIQWLFDGDHDFKPRKRTGLNQHRHIQAVASVLAEFAQRQLR